MAKLCKWFGISRQAYYQSKLKRERLDTSHEKVLKEVEKIRDQHMRMGTRKLYEKLKPFLKQEQIKMGRDALFNLLSENRMLVRKRRRRVKTTCSSHWFRKYPNLIKGFVPSTPNQLWVSDITYWKISKGFVYISLITDVYSHKIVGYHVADTLESIHTLQALKSALSDFKKESKSQFQLIHHSDRGIQYCSHEYTGLLKKNTIAISMTENGDPLENPVAERVNGIIKEEYLKNYIVNDLDQAKTLLDYVVRLYNEDRPHSSISNMTPSTVHQNKIKTKRLWKNYYNVNLYQDEKIDVNLTQDLSNNL
jgi:putative transposase